MLPGVHRVKITLAGGRVGEYWYAWRGGPRILKAVAKTTAALLREVEAQAAEAAIAYKAAVKPAPSGAFLDGLITKFLSPPEGHELPAHLAKLSPRTVGDLRTALDVVRTDLGELELAALAADGARKVLLDWRGRYASTPKTADTRMEALAKVLKWAKDNDEIRSNPIEEWPRLYHANRAEVVWTKADLIKLLRGSPAPFRTAVLLAIFTGFRGSDLVRVAWQHVGKDAIALPTGKSRGKRVAIVPITPKLRALLDAIGRKDVGTVLTSSTGEPWTHSGLQTAMQREKRERKIKGLRFHDLRGTAATNFIRAGLPIPDVATIMGWDKVKTETLASYVTAEAVAEGMLERLRKNRR
ncbi:tyrosine-type recombinase/integrase [Phenylobacterium immobile]|uniref:tyrosine-type recombinase/integrase n=1 Tax=Phenylobacterium immobile TaxID=21 RepID=UPI000A6D13D0|nr:tyrosine-type recombinase/integrase [Phenylobacterium immobile]